VLLLLLVSMLMLMALVLVVASPNCFRCHSRHGDPAVLTRFRTVVDVDSM
jgi:hypothetical protein